MTWNHQGYPVAGHYAANRSPRARSPHFCGKLTVSDRLAPGDLSACFHNASLKTGEMMVVNWDVREIRGFTLSKAAQSIDDFINLDQTLFEFLG